MLIVGSPQDARLIDAAAMFLRQAGLVVEAAEAGTRHGDPSARLVGRVAIVVPHVDDPGRSAALFAARAAAKTAKTVVAVARAGDHLPLPARTFSDVVRMGGDPNLMRARLLESFVDAKHFRAIVVPGITAPSGVTAWSATQVIASCDDSGRVVAVNGSTGQAITLMSGVVEPHGVSLDRRTLMVAAKGSNTIHTGLLLDGRFAPVRDIRGTRTVPITAPHHAMQFAGEVYVVDTDGHRILQGAGNATDPRLRLRPLDVGADLKNPCGMAVWHGLLLVADTFHDRLLAVDPGGAGVVAELELPVPVQIAVAPDGTIAAIANDGLHLLQLIVGGAKPVLRPLATYPSGGGNPLRAPFGVTIDRTGKLYIADRGRSVLWLAEMGELLSDSDLLETN